MSVASRLPAFLLLGLVLLAAALLTAGYGVAVGVGVIAGLVLGGAVILAFMAMNPRSGSSVGFGTWGTRGGSLNRPDHELIERHGRNSMRVARVDAGALRRVIPFGDAVEAGGARVELIALEIREDGAIATLVAHTRPPMGPVGHRPRAEGRGRRTADRGEALGACVGNGNQRNWLPLTPRNGADVARLSPLVPRNRL